MQFGWGRLKSGVRRGKGWALYEQFSLVPPRSLPRGQRLVVALASVRTQVASGGFDFYFSYSYGDEAAQAVEAARLAGCEELAVLIGEAMARLAGDSYPANATARADLIDTSSMDFDDLDNALYDLENRSNLDAALDQLTHLTG